MNLHRFTDMRYKDGALNISREGMKKFTDELGSTVQLSHHQKPQERKKLSFEEIKKRRETNPDFATGKKFKRTKGFGKKLNKKFK